MFHEWTCRADPTLTCSKGCGKVFSRKQTMAIHAARCDGTSVARHQSLECSKGCGKIMSRPDARLRHERACTGEPKREEGPDSHACPAPECGATFKRRYNRDRHAAGCKKARPDSAAPPPAAAALTCAQCNAVFSRRDALQRHARTCGVVFACAKGCGDEFTSERKRAEHEAECRYEPRRYWCPACPWTGYARMRDYERHLRSCKHTQDPLPEPYTGEYRKLD